MILLNRLKTLLRQPSIWLWTLVFPICLASFEYAAFGKLTLGSVIETMDIHIVEEEEYKIDSELKTIFLETKLDEDESLYHVIEVNSLEEGLVDFNAKKLDMLLYKDNDKFVLKTKDSTTNAAITTQIIEQYQVAAATIKKAFDKYQEDLAAGKNPVMPDSSGIIADLTEDFHYFNDTTRNFEANSLTIYFYGLIAMMCLYATIWGENIVKDIRADQSPLGIRITVAPTSKYKLIGLYYLAASILQVISCVVLFVYLKWILGVSLGSNSILVLLGMLVGSFTGISLGMLVAILLKGSSEKKQAFLNIIVLSLCILAGLMFVDLKKMVDMHAPFMKYINPAQLITDSLYYLYYYSTTEGYWLRIGILMAMNLLFIGITIFKMRGEKYASI